MGPQAVAYLASIVKPRLLIVTSLSDSLMKLFVSACFVTNTHSLREFMGSLVLVLPAEPGEKVQRFGNLCYLCLIYLFYLFYFFKHLNLPGLFSFKLFCYFYFYFNVFYLLDEL